MVGGSNSRNRICPRNWDRERLWAVVDATGGAIAAKLFIASPTSKAYIVKSADDHGNFKLDPLRAGVYRIAITASGFRPAARDIRITSDEAIDLGVIQLAVGRCDFPGLICDTFGTGPRNTCTALQWKHRYGMELRSRCRQRRQGVRR